MISPAGAISLETAVTPGRAKLLDPGAVGLFGGVAAEIPILVILAAGKGARFGQAPKYVQPMRGAPLSAGRRPGRPPAPARPRAVSTPDPQ